LCKLLILTGMANLFTTINMKVTCNRHSGHDNQTIFDVYTFIGPCIVIYFYSKTNEMHQLFKIYFILQ
jgi:hypothetical protein